MNTKLKKLHYPIGLISLIFLPIFCCIFILCNHGFDQIPVVSYNTFHGKLKDENSFNYNRDFKQINLTGNDKSDKIILKNIQNEIHNLVKSQDTLIGIRIHFNSESKFWTLVKAVEICSIEKVKFYIPKENDIWIFNPKKKEVWDELFFCGVGYSRCFIEEKTIFNSEEQRIILFKETIEFIKKYYTIILMFMVITILSIQQLILLKSK